VNWSRRSTPTAEWRVTGDWFNRTSPDVLDDQEFSLTDGVSFSVMDTRSIREALTLDRHFTTAGFVAVPS
jgi:predicted nucleic acid-binding protein